VRVRHIVGVAALASFGSCLAPTEIVLELSTDVSCDTVGQYGVAVAVGPPGNDDSGVVTSTLSCDGGWIGTLVLGPSNGADTIGIRVMLGTTASAESCTDQSPTCIIARRQIQYIEHQPLYLPIALQQACIGDPCDPTSTCVNGVCVDAAVSCVGNACNVPDASAGTPDASPDAGNGCEWTTTLTSTAAPIGPRIARGDGGYVVAYSTAQSGTTTLVSFVSDDGGVSGTSSTVAASPIALGPLGTDGVHFALVLQLAANTFATTVTTLGANAVTQTGTGVAGLGGAILVDAGTFATAATVSGAPALVTFNQAVQNIQVLPSDGGLSNVSLNVADYHYLSSTANGACNITVYDSALNVYAFTAPAAPCDVSREAIQSFSDGILLRHDPTTNTVYLNAGVVAPNVRANDFLIFAVAPQNYRIVFIDTTNAFGFVTYSSTDGGTGGYPPIPPIGPSAPAQNIDAVSDDLVSRHWAIAYHDGFSSIVVRHYCN
jgi:hypothetical protein